jgi:branched-chain amino acid transport system ATP-binding protein
LIAGQLKPSAGRVTFAGEALDRLRPDQRARRGIAIVYQGDRIFRRMTVRENVMVGAHGSAKHGFLEAALRLPRCRNEDRELKARADAALERVGLEKLADQPAESLPLGQQRTMQLARALVAEPKLLLLDEPAAGLRAPERAQLARLIREARAQGQTVLLVEHDVALVTSLSDVITVLDLGRVIAEGEPDAVRRNPRVLAAYLGEATP